MKNGSFSKSWREKMEKDIKPRLVEVPDKWALKIGKGKMLIPTPLLVEGVIKKIPRGKLSTVNNIREYLAHVYNADITCPLTTGIFLNIVANAAEEDKAKGKSRITPYWRILKEGGILNPKFPGAVKQQADYLEHEGIELIKGKQKDRYFVKNFDKRLMALN
jgi:6-O-methylguanine DNA methyltransferase, DNA binding domain